MKSAYSAGFAAAAVVAVSLLAGFGPRLSAGPEKPAKDIGAGPRPGDVCVVYLRGDAGGISYHDRVPDLSSMVSRDGTVTADDGTWLELRDGDKAYLLPHASILAVRLKERGKGNAKNDAGEAGR